MFSELFYTNLFIGFSGMILGCGALFYRSKCDKVNICCGLISIHRNIESELQNDAHIEMPDTHLDIENNTRHGSI
jgi:hypothetical protein